MRWSSIATRGAASRASVAAAAAPPLDAAAAAASGRALVFASSPAPAHDRAGHPECAARGVAVEDAVAASGLDGLDGLFRRVPFTPAPRNDLLTIHAPAFVDGLRAMCSKLDGDAVINLEQASAYITRATFNAALGAAGAAFALADAVAAPRPPGAPSVVGFGAVRPPGHHARPSALTGAIEDAFGFCFFSTAALAVLRLQAVPSVRRVAVLDYDVHHGNGTNDFFHARSDVLFISTHQAGLFPGTGKAADVGSGDGEGATINVPLPADAGDGAARAAWEQVIGPALTRFKPDAIVVSSGYDAHWSDPLASMQLRTSTFHWLAQRLAAAADDMCGGRLLFLMEGGYSPRHLGLNVVDTCRGVLGLDSADTYNPDLLRDEPTDKVAAALKEARAIHGL